MPNTEEINNIAIVKTIGKRFPISGHPLWGEKFDASSNAFNLLAKILNKAGIDIELLHDVRTATADLERLSYPEVYKLGFSDGHKEGYEAGCDSVDIIDELNSFLLQKGLIANDIVVDAAVTSESSSDVLAS